MSTPEQSLGINQKFLDIVGLTETVQSNFSARNQLELLKASSESTQAGEVLFSEKVLNIPYPKGPLGEVSFFKIDVRNLAYEDIPDNLKGALDFWIINEGLDQEGHKAEADDTTYFAREALKRFASLAFEHKYWQVFVNAYDVLAEGELVLLPLEMIGSLPLENDDYTDRLKIAEALQKRAEIKQRKSKAETIVPATSEQLQTGQEPQETKPRTNDMLETLGNPRA